MTMRPFVSEVAMHVMSTQRLQLQEQVPFLLSLLDLATKHPASRVAALVHLQQFTPPVEHDEHGNEQLNDWANNISSEWLVKNCDWEPIETAPMPDESGLFLVVGQQIYDLINDLMKEASPVEGYDDGHLLAGFVVESWLPENDLYLGMFNGPFGPYLEAFVYPWIDGVPVSSPPVVAPPSSGLQLELQGLGETPLKLQIVAAAPSVQSPLPAGQ